MVKTREMYSLANNEPGVNVEQVKINELYSFEGHPFKVKRDQELFELRRSIETEGVLVPLLVRNSPYRRGYEIISGHRRKEAALWAGLNYKMRLEAMKHQGRIGNSTSDPMEPKSLNEFVGLSVLEAEVQRNGKITIKKTGTTREIKGLRSNEELARMVGESVSQIKRYIRLTKLISKILDMVDKEQIALRSAVELSFLTEDEQYELYAIMEFKQCIPDFSQANRLKRMSQQQCLDIDKMYEILQEVKPNQKEQVKIPLERIRRYFPENFTPAQQTALIESLLKEWAKKNRKQK